MTNYSWSPQVSGPGKCVCVCVCVSMLVPWQTEELRLREAGRVCTAYCCTDERLCPLTASICSAHTHTRTLLELRSSSPPSIWHKMCPSKRRELEQMRLRWTRMWWSHGRHKGNRSCPCLLPLIGLRSATQFDLGFVYCICLLQKVIKLTSLWR